MKASELFVRCLENEGVENIFGIPGEENIDVMDVLLDSTVRFITTRHEQGAAFMADVYGRLTGRAGVCLATLGPGATNLVTPVADANMDHAPVVAIAGQAATTRMHKESHQHLDLVSLFRPITKYSVQIREPEVIPEIVRKAFKIAEAEKPGVSFIDFPENIAGSEIQDKQPLLVQRALPPAPPAEKVRQAAAIISEAAFPIIMVGNGAIRSGAAAQVVHFAEALNIPVASTFMAKGVIPSSHELSLGAVGLQARDFVMCGFDRADVIICIGYDMIEYHPHLWHKDKDRKIIHIDAHPAEVDEHYIVAAGVIGDIGTALPEISALASRQEQFAAGALRQVILDELAECAEDPGFPMKPQRIIWDLRKTLSDRDIVISDVGAHKMWMARMYQAQQPNTCIISNGFASMGVGVPGAIAAGDRDGVENRHPDRDPGVDRQRVRPDQVAPAPALRSSQQHHVQEPRLREVRRELRRQGLPRRGGIGTRADPVAGRRRRHGGRDRLPDGLRGKHEAHGETRGIGVSNMKVCAQSHKHKTVGGTVELALPCLRTSLHG